VPLSSLRRLRSARTPATLPPAAAQAGTISDTSIAGVVIMAFLRGAILCFVIIALLVLSTLTSAQQVTEFTCINKVVRNYRETCNIQRDQHSASVACVQTSRNGTDDIAMAANQDYFSCVLRCRGNPGQCNLSRIIEFTRDGGSTELSATTSSGHSLYCHNTDEFSSNGRPYGAQVCTIDF
jgi:hypothetical protein